MAFLTRIDQKKRRLYAIRIAPTLFGEWSLVREWGRIGSPGTMCVAIFEQYQEAEKAERPQYQATTA